MTEWQNYPALSAAPVSGDTVLILDTTATPPTAGQVKQISSTNLANGLTSLATSPEFTSPVIVKYNGGTAMTVSSDGTTTSAGAIAMNCQNENQAFVSIFGNTLGIPAYFVPNVTTSHWAPSFGAVTTEGFGVLGATDNTGAVAFSVLNFNQFGTGLGVSTFTCLDNNTVETFNNTLDDGSGNMTTVGVSHQKGGTDTSNTAAYSTPTFTSGTAKTLSTTQDVMLYIAVKTAISVTLSIGSTSAASNSIVPATTLPVGAFVSVRIPAGWWVKLTCATMADLQLSQVTC